MTQWWVFCSTILIPINLHWLVLFSLQIMQQIMQQIGCLSCLIRLTLPSTAMDVVDPVNLTQSWSANSTAYVLMQSHSTSNLPCLYSSVSWLGQENGTAARNLYSLPNVFRNSMVQGKSQTVAVTWVESIFYSLSIESKFYPIEKKF